jgi:co-chaperonin GroES (HSP10)
METEALTESKFLKDFTAVAAEVMEKVRLKGSYILVERLPEGERKTKSGIILTNQDNQVGTLSDNLPAFYVVLAVGEGYDVDSEGNKPELDVKPGNVILLPRQGVNLFSTFGEFSKQGSHGMIGISLDSEAQMIFEDLTAFKNYFEDLNQG